MTMDELLLQAVEQRLLRPLDVQFALMVAQEAHPAVKLTAAILSRDAGEGHVCLPISRLADDELLSAKTTALSEQILELTGAAESWLPLLLDSEAVSRGERPTPMILCGERLYLNRMWRNELTVARFFNEANQVLEVDEARLASTLDALFPPGDEIDWQKVAAAVALTRRISVISGGPGTGKTTTVAKLLAALIQTNASPRCRIRLAAPTGKAAARLTESLGAALRRLPLTDEQKALVPTEASTLHRLLGAQPGSQRMRYHAGNPLHLDVLVVDEASMIDLPMMSRLIDALPEHGRVIFLGDRDQLASVEAGAVLGDICAWVNAGFTPARAAQLGRLTGQPVPAGESEIAGALRPRIALRPLDTLRPRIALRPRRPTGRPRIALGSGRPSRARWPTTNEHGPYGIRLRLRRLRQRIANEHHSRRCHGRVLSSTVTSCIRSSAYTVPSAISISTSASPTGQSKPSVSDAGSSSDTVLATSSTAMLAVASNSSACVVGERTCIRADAPARAIGSLYCSVAEPATYTPYCVALIALISSVSAPVTLAGSQSPHASLISVIPRAPVTRTGQPSGRPCAATVVISTGALLVMADTAR